MARDFLTDSSDSLTAASPAPTGGQYPLDVGEVSVPREISSSVGSQVSGQMRLLYFTARKTEIITQLVASTGATAAAATPTLIRYGVFEEDPTTKNLALVAATANDTTILNGTFQQYTKATTSPWQKIAGRRYATGVLVVTATTMPALIGLGPAFVGELARSPRVIGAVGSLADLPSSITAGSIGQVGSGVALTMLP